MAGLKSQNKSKILLLGLFLLVSCILCPVARAFKLGDMGPIREEDRILILAPHPDDETLACAGVIQEALKKKAPVKIVYLTNGDHNQLAFIIYEKRLVFRRGEFIHMGQIRRQEAQKAMALLGLGQENLIFLGYPDFGTFGMFSRYWKSSRPFKSLLTRLNKVPYPENFSYGKSFLPENILADLEKIIRGYRPTKIFVSHPADTNGDHRALALFLNIALWDLEDKIPRPRVYSYLVHHTAWPLPRRYHPSLGLGVPKDLEGAGRWLSLGLSQEEVEKKYNALRSYKSQTSSSAFYLFSFARINELFQLMPLLDPVSRTSAAGDGFNRFSIQYDHLVISLSHPLDNHDISKVSLYLFGYRADTPFSDMPKIFLKLNSNSIIVFDGRRRLQYNGVIRINQGQDTIIKIPLELLNNPEKALISVRIFSQSVPYVQGLWNKARLK